MCQLLFFSSLHRTNGMKGNWGRTRRSTKSLSLLSIRTMNPFSSEDIEEKESIRWWSNKWKESNGKEFISNQSFTHEGILLTCWLEVRQFKLINCWELSQTISTQHHFRSNELLTSSRSAQKGCRSARLRGVDTELSHPYCWSVERVTNVHQSIQSSIWSEQWITFSDSLCIAAAQFQK